MSRHIALAKVAADIVLPGTCFRATSLELPEDLGYRTWADLGRQIIRLSQGIQFWLGDWLNFGEKRYGEKYTQALDSTGYALGTLANLASVAGRVKSHDRREILSWGHHAAVAYLPRDDQVHWLDLAEYGETLPNGERKRWSVTMLRQEIKADGEQRAADQEQRARPEAEADQAEGAPQQALGTPGESLEGPTSHRREESRTVARAPSHRGGTSTSWASEVADLGRLVSSYTDAALGPPEMPNSALMRPIKLFEGMAVSFDGVTYRVVSVYVPQGGPEVGCLKVLADPIVDF